MKKLDYVSGQDHLAGPMIVRAMDDELAADERLQVAAHLAECETCRREFETLAGVSRHLKAAMNGFDVEASTDEGARRREQLMALMEAREKTVMDQPSASRVLRRFGWGMAIAATLALGIIVAPRSKSPNGAVSEPAASYSNSLEVDGETFIPLPYSNPDLPMNAPRIVEMQVPLSSLAGIGITLEPISSQVAEQDRSVLADVLVGTDGQPLGVHVLSAE
jgi:hypothetical protein